MSKRINDKQAFLDEILEYVNDPDFQAEQGYTTNKEYYKKDLDFIWTAIMTAVKNEARNNDTSEIHLPHFGTLQTKVKSQYKGINPRTGDPVLVPNMKRVNLRIFDSFKDYLNRRDEA